MLQCPDDRLNNHRLDIGVMSENWPIIQLSFPVKTIRWLKVGSMLTHRLRRWANIDPTLPIIQLWNAFPANTTRFLKAGPGLGWRWATTDLNLGESLVFAGFFRSHFSLGRVIWRWPIIHPMPSGHFFPLGVAFGGGQFDETPVILLLFAGSRPDVWGGRDQPASGRPESH